MQNTFRARRSLGPSGLRSLTLVISLSAACVVTPVSPPPVPPPQPPHWSAVPPLPLDERIRTNQLGFQPAEPKHVAAAWPSAAPLPAAERVFHIVPLDTPWKPALVGALVDLGVDADSGEHVLRGDFSALQTPGHYRVVLPRRGYSAPFRIHSEVYRDVLRLATRFFYLQRSGAAKDDPLTGLRHGADYAVPAPQGPKLSRTSKLSGYNGIAKASAHLSKSVNALERSGVALGCARTGLERARTGLERARTGLERARTGLERARTAVERAGAVLERARAALDRA